MRQVKTYRYELLTFKSIKIEFTNILGKDPATGEDLEDKSKCVNGIDKGVVNQLCKYTNHLTR